MFSNKQSRTRLGHFESQVTDWWLSKGHAQKHLSPIATTSGGHQALDLAVNTAAHDQLLCTGVGKKHNERNKQRGLAHHAGNELSRLLAEFGSSRAEPNPN